MGSLGRKKSEEDEEAAVGRRRKTGVTREWRRHRGMTRGNESAKAAAVDYAQEEVFVLREDPIWHSQLSSTRRPCRPPYYDTGRALYLLFNIKFSLSFGLIRYLSLSEQVSFSFSRRDGNSVPNFSGHARCPVCPSVRYTGVTTEF